MAARKSNDANDEGYVNIERRATVTKHSQQELVDRYSKIPSSSQIDEENPEVEAIYELWSNLDCDGHNLQVLVWTIDTKSCTNWLKVCRACAYLSILDQIYFYDCILTMYHTHIPTCTSTHFYSLLYLYIMIMTLSRKGRPGYEATNLNNMDSSMCHW